MVLVSAADEPAKRAASYAQSRQLVIDFQYPLGQGIDGIVWETSRPSALKVLERAQTYRLEVECYRRLQDARLSRIRDFAVPKLVDADDELLAIEMTIVSPPFLLDFGKVYLDSPPPYWNDSEIMANWEAEGKENFGEQWSIVLSLVGALQKYGIWYVDPKPATSCLVIEFAAR
jgi:hypothetical protein